MAAADGDFVVVWTSRGSSGTDSSYGSVQGQRFGSLIELLVEDVIEFVKGLDAEEDFSNRKLQNALVNKLEAVLASVRPGDLAGICQAIDKLMNDIFPKDRDGDPRPRDWVTGFPAQQDLEDRIIAILDDLQDAATALGGCPVV